MICSRGVWIFVLISVLVMSLPFSFADEDWGCCIDNQLGYCRLVQGQDAIDSCIGISGNLIDVRQLCTPSAFDESIPVTNNSLCQSSGFCCFEDTREVSANFGQQSCEIAGGFFREGSNAEVCGFAEIPEQSVTCLDLGGFYCQTQPPGGTNLNSFITSFADRPGTEYSCYNIPCQSDVCPVSKGVNNYEVFCNDGKNNDGDCEIDFLDSDCGFGVTGTIVDMNNNPVSNVKVEFVNTNHELSDFQDVFRTLSVGEDGVFRYDGLSRGTYTARVIDQDYVSNNNLSFTITPSSALITSGLQFEVALRNSFKLSGTVISPESGEPVSGALVSLEEEGKFAITNSQGFFEIFEINREFGNTLTLFAYAEGYSSVEKIFLPDSDSETEVEIELGAIVCGDSPVIPVLNSIEHTRGKPEVSLSFSSACAVDKFIIFRCDGTATECANDFNIESSVRVPGNQFTYTDNSLDWETDYTYFLRGVKNGLSSKTSNKISIFSGHESCEGRFNSGSFCEYEYTFNVDLLNTKKYISSEGRYCDLNNSLLTYSGSAGPVQCSESTKCVEENSGLPTATTYCQPLLECIPDSSNFFGLYFTEDSCEGVNNENYCVYDFSRSNTDFCFGCDQYVDCSDYRSESSCQQNVCGIGNCDWKPVNEELGTGICISQDTVSCNSFNNPFNEVFGSGDVSLCEEIGGCSIDKSSNLCTDCDSLSCYDYNNKNSCVGPFSQSVILINQFDNSFALGSQDTCGFSSCRWSELDNSCFKDSNNDNVDDCAYLLENNRVIDSLIPGLNAYAYEVCIKDNQSPISSVQLSSEVINPTSSVGGKIQADFSVYDLASGYDVSFDVKDLYACITPKNADMCRSFINYVEIPVRDNRRYLIIENANEDLEVSIYGRTFKVSPGENVLKYFSIDHAGNTEVVNVQPFVVDIRPPEITQKIVKQFKESSTTIDIFTESNEDIFCWVSLQGCENLGNCDNNAISQDNVTFEVLQELADQFSITNRNTKENVPDGAHLLKSVCSDRAGNVIVKENQLFVDRDARIFDPKPFGPTDKTTIELSVQTFSDVSCKYTQDITRYYDQIPNSQLLNKNFRSGNFVHTKTLTVATDQSHTYYIKCNHSPESIEQISFVQDNSAPVVDAKYGLQSLSNVNWLSDNEIQIVCEDSPEGGFGCDKIEYCLTDPPTLFDVTQIGSCLPQTEYSSPLQLNSPQTICYRAYENIIQNEGGRETQILCQNAFIDNSDPQIIVDPFLTTINSRTLQISGAVYDDSIKEVLNFSKDDSLSSLLSNREVAFITEEEPVADFDIVTTFSREDAGELSVLFNYLSASNSGAVRIHFDENEIEIGRRTFLGFTSFSKQELLEGDFYQLRISKKQGSVTAYLQNIVTGESQEIQTTQSYFLNSKLGKFGALIDGNNEELFNIKQSFTDLQVLYSSDPQISQLPKNIFLFVAGSLKEVQTTTGSFSFTTTLTQGNLYHGATYPVVLYAEDVSGRRSEQTTQNVRIDLAGPEVSSVDFIPTVDQEDDSYIEYSTAADIVLFASDEFSAIKSISLQLAQGAVDLEFNDINNSWNGRLDLQNSAAGTFDAIIRLEDVLGNVYIQTLRDAVIIDDRIDPIIIFDETTIYVNTLLPIISFTTQETASCSLLDENGDVLESGGFTTTHEFTITQELNGSINREISNDLSVLCSDRNSRRVTQNIEVIVDQRIPLYTVQQNELFAKTEILSRHSKSITALRALDMRFFTIADEPVSCRYAKGSKPNTFEEYPLATLNAFEYVLQDRSVADFIGSSEVLTYYFLCEDRAGNLGAVKELFVSSNPAIPPVLFELSVDSVVSFKSVRDLSCEYEVNGQTKEIPSIVETPSTFYYETEILSDLNPGENIVFISCTHDFSGTSSQLNYTTYVDSIDPEILIELDTVLITSLDVLQSNVSVVNLDISPNEFVELTVFVNDILQFADSFDTKQDVELVLAYGYNPISVVYQDLAGNTKSTDFGIILLNTVESFELSNALGSSIRKSFTGILRNDNQIVPETIEISSSNGNFTISSDIISFTTQDLEQISSNTEKQFMGKTIYDIVTLKGLSSTEHLVHKEVFYFHPYAEEFIFDSPLYKTLRRDDLVNDRSLPVLGITNQENYAFENTLVYGLNETSQVLNSGYFNQEFVQTNGRTKLQMSLISDLDILTITSFTTIFDTIGPDPEISIYPAGQESFVPNPEFLVVFQDPATIVDAVIRTTTGNVVYQFNSNDLSNFPVFYERLPSFANLVNETSYIFTITANDSSGNVNSKDFTFSYTNKPLELTIISPEFGFSKTANFTLVLQADRFATCRISENNEAYSLKNDMTRSDFLHSYQLSLIEGQVKTFYVQCQEQGNTLSAVVPIQLGVDKDIPIIESIDLVNKEIINNIPYITNFPVFGNFSVSATEDVYCKYDVYQRNEQFSTSYENMSAPSNCNINIQGNSCFSNPTFTQIGNLQDDAAYSVVFICRDKAGWESALSSSFEFQVDLSQGQKVQIISPESKVSSRTIPITIVTNIPMDSCRYGLDGQAVSARFSRITQNNTIFNSTTSISDGDHSIAVSCVAGNNTYNASRNFVVDSSKPIKGAVLVAETSTSVSSLFARAVNFSDNESGIDYYEYAIGTSSFGRSDWNSISNWTQVSKTSFSAKNLDLEIGETYYWSVRAWNDVGLVSDVVSSSGTEIVTVDISDSDPECTECGPDCQVECSVGDVCVFADDCYSDDLYCTDDYFCDLITNFSGVDEQLNDSFLVEDVDEISLEPVELETNTEIISKDLSWLYWLLAFGILIVLAGGGYYVYVQYYVKDEKNISSKKQHSFDTALTSTPEKEKPVSSSSFEPKELSKKDKLRAALKKKLVQDQKKGDTIRREKLFNEFSDKEQKDYSIPNRPRFDNNVVTKEQINEIKKRLSYDDKVQKTYSYKPSGEYIHGNDLVEKHKDLVRKTDVSDMPEDVVSKLKSITSKPENVATTKKSTVKKPSKSATKGTKTIKKPVEKSTIKKVSKTKSSSKESSIDKLKSLNKKK